MTSLHHHQEDVRFESAKDGLPQIITIRCPSGISGDMLLTGLAVTWLEYAGIETGTEQANAWLDERLGRIMPELAGCAKIGSKLVNGIAGWHLYLDLPHSHEHRNLADIQKIIDDAQIELDARHLANACFELLAQCEAKAHHKPLQEVHFHEVGALDSILDICAVVSLYVELGKPKVVCSPLPVADGQISCAHGILTAPAPTVLYLMQGLPVQPFGGRPNAGELVTPTAIALLRTLGVEFGPWPEFVAQKTCLVYGGKVFENAANGAIFAGGNGL